MEDVECRVVNLHQLGFRQGSDGAAPPAVFRRWMYLTLLKEPSPVLDAASSNSHGIVVSSGVTFEIISVMVVMASFLSTRILRSASWYS
jgi:hypothetical protein